MLLYATVGLRDGFHVAIESIPARFEHLNRWADRWVAALAILFGWVTLTAGIAYVARSTGQKTAALQMPIEVLYLCVPVCGVLFILHGVARLIAPPPRNEAPA